MGEQRGQCDGGGGCGLTTGVDRRMVLTGSAAVLATLALGACAPADETAGSPGTATPTGSESASQSAAASATATESAAASQSASASGTPDGGGGEAIAGTGDFPVGGGVVVTTDAGTVVVTHPADNEFVAFNGRCPHAGCPVSEVTENTIVCLCHGSTFDGSTGARLEGPAPTGLTPVGISVQGDQIYLA